MSHNRLFEVALGISQPWFVQSIGFDQTKRVLTIGVDFVAGSRFAHPDAQGEHPVHDTRQQRYRHLNFFEHECYLEVRVPRVRLPDGAVRQVEPDWAGKLSGFTLLFEALVVALCREMTFEAVARVTGLSWHRVSAICGRYVDLARAEADLSETTTLAVDETSYQRGHKYLTIAADAQAHKVIFVTPGRDSDTIAQLAEHLQEHGGAPERIRSVSMDMSGAYIKGVTEQLPSARITFDKFHVIAHASSAVDRMRRIEQKHDPCLKGMRWTLLKDRSRLNEQQRDDLDTFIRRAPSRRTARAWLYREQLREILDRKQINVATALLKKWCSNVMRSKVEPMKDVAKMVLSHFDGIVAWAQTRQTNGFLEAINGLFQAAKRKALGYTRFTTMRTVLFLIAGKLDLPNFGPKTA
ncbi:MAG: ISL3 family transposase [Rhodocyclaceae bacterium]|nr:ISL3 family transposase [Rhodocyclaceae bacterium]